MKHPLAATLVSGAVRWARCGRPRPLAALVRALAGLLALALVATACGSSDSDGGTAPGPDADSGGAPVATDADSGGAPRDAEVRDGGVAPEDVPPLWRQDVPRRKFGSPCVTNDDCESGWCIGWDEGYVCTETCIEAASGCPEGWECRQILNTLPDIVFTCYPSESHLCQPCASDFECGAGYCQTFGGQQRCTRPCNQARQCPSAYECVPTTSDDSGQISTQCVPVSGLCDCGPINVGAERSCVVRNEFGACWGRERCDGARGWVDCSATTPAAEDCNGADDDCDGVADEDLALPGDQCERAVPGIGTCTGTWYCGGGAGWVCTAATPSEEVCDYQDNNCDGRVDELFIDPASGEYLFLEHCGVCGRDCRNTLPHAAEACELRNGTPTCVVAACDESYIQLDDFTCIPTQPTLCQPCLTDDACLSPGDRCVPLTSGTFCGRDCAPGSLHGETCPDGYECAQPFADVPEVWQCVPLSGSCDCTPATHGLVKGCFVENAAGRCFGTQVCDSTEGWSPCDARTPERETCDGEDDNCNGLADEGVVAPATPCQTSWTDPRGGDPAVCTGTWVCTGVGATDGWECLAPQAGPEACDYRDNDCDGRTDEDFKVPGTNKYATYDHCGACNTSCEGAIPHAVTTDCDGTQPVPYCVVTQCEPGYYPAGPNFCQQARDSTCQPCASDDACPVPGDRCLLIDGAGYCARDCGADNVFGTPLGECAFGYQCVGDPDGGRPHCQPISGSCSCRRVEDAGTSRSCIRQNPFGTCTGLQVCDPAVGWSDCSATEPRLEDCDGIDNDCDGSVDEGVAEPATPCVVANAFGTCSGDWFCGKVRGVTAWHCDAATPLAEVCDYDDNDCDGLVDEDFKDAVSGLYGHIDNCGLCGLSCRGSILFASQIDCDADTAPAHCVALDCEEGYYRPVGLDNVCVPLNVTDCSPCGNDSHCEGLPGRCLAIDLGNFCARDCPTGSECPPEYVCAGGRCLPQSNSCTCTSAQDGNVRTCFVSNTWGTCTGTQTCVGGQRWSDCSARVPAREACNGIDDDCNGRIDDGLNPPDQACLRTNIYGTCVGAWVCSLAGGQTLWTCNAPTPAPDHCDYVDNDCDGRTDEDFRDPLTGGYVNTLNCGACGVSCVGAIPHATTECRLFQGNPRCEVAQCDPGYYLAGPLTCLTVSENLCAPCATDDNCQVPGDRCLALDGGTFCGRDCSAGNLHDLPAGQCPPGYVCAAIPGGRDQCRPESGSCSCLPEDVGNARPCIRSNDHGSCFGQEVCQADGGWSPCSATVPGPEICDGRDNDCNNYVDDVPGRGATCTIDNAFGSCPGTLDCLAGQPGLQCAGQVPTAEVCDYVDNDCNGVVDDGFYDLYQICTVGTGACQRYGFRECTADARGTACNARAGQGQPERCNRIDDDCDGLTDETWSELDTGCTVGTGACQRGGIWVCRADGLGTVCSATPGLPLPEECNGLDDDCNGVVDPPDSIGCITFYTDADRDTWGLAGSGVCLCLPDGQHTALVAGDCDDTRFAVNPSRPEICNYIDDDCDGQTDENVLSECGDCDRFCSIANLGPQGDEPYTPTPDNASGVWTNPLGGLILDTDRINLTFIWIANSDEDTVSQLNTLTGSEVGRYRVCDNPSRTAVDLFGNMYVACRNDDKVAKVILDRNLCIDRNRNGVIDTSVDLNGDRRITGAEILPLGQDECVAWIVSPLGGDLNAVARAMVVDRFNRPWVGYYNSVPGKGFVIQQLDPETGAVTREVGDLPTGVYGLAIDRQGRIWGSGRITGRLLRVDVEQNPPFVTSYLPPASCRQLYGIVVDVYGRVWLANSECGYVYRFDPATAQWRSITIDTATHGYTRGIAANKDGQILVGHHSWTCSLGRSATVIDAASGNIIRNIALAGSGVVGTVGVAYDYQGYAWAVNQCTSNATKFDPATGTVILTQPVGTGPYTYSDMTGYNLHVFTAPNGFYRHTVAGWPQYGTRWVSLNVNADVPANTYMDLRLRAAPTVSTLRTRPWSRFLGPFPPASFPYDLQAVPGGLTGDYLEVELWMFSRQTGTTPTVWGIDVQYTALNPPN
jgi:hypothetical protein